MGSMVLRDRWQWLRSQGSFGTVEWRIASRAASLHRVKRVWVEAHTGY